MLRLYVNGKLEGEAEREFGEVSPGKALLIGGSGRGSTGYGSPYFWGTIKEVRIYNRALSEKEVQAHYRTTNVTRRVELKPYVYPFKNQILVTLDPRGLGELPAGATAKVELLGPDQEGALQKSASQSLSSWEETEVTLRVGDLPPGTCRIRATVRDGVGQRIGKPSVKELVWPEEPSWPGSRGRVRILNNLVAELLNVGPPELVPKKTYTFFNPRDGWVFFSSTADVVGPGTVVVSLAPTREKTELIVHHQNGENESLEAMRFLPSGEYTLVVSPEGKPILRNLIVRSIPELIYGYFPTKLRVPAAGSYDWDFLQKHMLANINCIKESGHRADRDKIRPHIQEWKRRGRRWIKDRHIGPERATAEEYHKYWTQPLRDEPLLDGMIIDEFGWRKPEDYPRLTAALRRFHQNEQRKGKTFYGYTNASLTCRDVKKLFMQEFNSLGCKSALNRYPRERPTELAARKLLESELKEQVLCWKRAVPGCEKNMILNLGYMVLPPETENANPSADWKVWMDMEFNLIANDPAFWGIYGICEYHAGAADEETVRWQSKLYRHYFIEGKTEMLSPEYGFKYSLDHIENPDFDEGVKGWTISPADDASVSAKSIEGYGKLQGRYPDPIEGNNFLWMKRSNAKPNLVSQQIKNLKPGRLYSLKMITADYQDVSKGKSREQKHVVAIRITNADLVSEKSFQYVYAQKWHHIGSFSAESPAWLNYHYHLFRARGDMASLTISDWLSDEQPGGLVGQELMYNFIEVQPYLED